MLLPLVSSLSTTNNSNSTAGENTPGDCEGTTAAEESTQAAAWDQVADAAVQQPHATGDVNPSAPEALFHLLDKTLLLKHLRELKAEKAVNGKAFYKSSVKWEDLNQTQRNGIWPNASS
jgi:hypothetical protein